MPTHERQGPDSTNARVIEIRAERKLSRPQIAAACGVSLSAVDRWLYDPKSRHYRRTPDRAVKLLEFELGLAKPKRKAKRERAIALT